MVRHASQLTARNWVPPGGGLSGWGRHHHDLAPVGALVTGNFQGTRRWRWGVGHLHGGRVSSNKRAHLHSYIPTRAGSHLPASGHSKDSRKGVCLPALVLLLGLSCRIQSASLLFFFSSP